VKYNDKILHQSKILKYYVEGENKKKIQKDIDRIFKKVSKNKIREGDLLFFSISGKNDHIGIYLQNDRFVHASTSKGVVISSLNNNYYKKHFHFAGRINK